MKTLTMYLPQFHRVPENDEWWGEGFTEWTAVKAAEPLYEGHRQPRIPLNEYYYDLLDKDTMIFQANLMKTYGIDGQCFYHYYFKEGRKILEKPAENLLKWRDVDMPFCFCWANGHWARTWSKVKGNSWADKFEKEKTDIQGLLLEQEYGREEEWREHFEYLLPFFRDERYLKANGFPIFMIYAPRGISCLYQMIDYWRELAIEAKVGGLYIIAMNITDGLAGVDAVLLHTPHTFWQLINKENGVWRPDYSSMWKNILEASPIKGYRTYFEGMADCDDTPRRGTNGGISFKGFSVDLFRENMYQLYQKSIILGNEFVFINAWNEWGEGMYLEPDEENGYACLEAVRDAKMAAMGQDYMRNIDEIVAYKKDEEKEKNSSLVKYQKIIGCLSEWLTLKEKNLNICGYLCKYNVKNVAVYGYGVLGKHLIVELDKLGIGVKYIIDRRKNMQAPYIVKTIDESLDIVDAILVTPIDDFEEIYDRLKAKIRCRIFSMRELLENVGQE